MTHRHRATLKEELGADVPAVAKLDPQQQAILLKQIHDARDRQHAMIKAAMDGALSFVPALLRGPIRALFRHS